MAPAYDTIYEMTRAPLVMKFFKPRYGLKQNPESWHRKIDALPWESVQNT